MTTRSAHSVAITGASGYVGSALAESLEQSGHRVVRLGRSQEDGELNLRWTLDSKRDLSHEFRVRSVDTLIHCAYDFAAYGRREEELNLGGSHRLLDAFRDGGGRRAILISTMSAFTGTRSQYGRAKLSIEKLFSQPEECTLRLGLVFDDQPRGMVGALLELARKLRFVLPMVGAGRWRLHVLHLDDLRIAVRSLVEAIEFPLRSGDILTIANPMPTEFREIVRQITRSRGMNPFMVPIPWRLIWLALKFTEAIGVRGRLRADGIIGLVCSDRAPTFDIQALGALGLGKLRKDITAECVDNVWIRRGAERRSS